MKMGCRVLLLVGLLALGLTAAGAAKLRLASGELGADSGEQQAGLHGRVCAAPQIQQCLSRLSDTGAVCGHAKRERRQPTVARRTRSTGKRSDKWCENSRAGLTSRGGRYRSVNAESNRAFVLMQYIGYLRRNPNDPQDTDYTGYDFWLTKLNQLNGNFVAAEMVKAFITSSEYRQRFGPQ